MIRRPARVAVAALASLSAVFGLAACSGTKAGAAAVINGDRISQGTVNDYVVANAPTPTDQNGQPSSPRSIVVSALVNEQVFTALLEHNGGVPADSDVATQHDNVFSEVLGATGLTGSEADQALQSKILDPNNLKASFAPVFLRSTELELIAVQRLKLQTSAQLGAALKAAGINVSVNPRYGTWDPNAGHLTAGSDLPYLKPTSSPSAAAPSAP